MATKVVINGNTVDGIDIYVHEIPTSVAGFAGISGTLSLTSGTASTLAGAFIYAIKNNVVSGFAFTDAAGNYNINGLTPGTYSLSVDRPGYTEVTSSTGTVWYNSAGNPVNVSVPLLISSVTTLVGGTSALQPTQYTSSKIIRTRLTRRRRFVIHFRFPAGLRCAYITSLARL